MGLSAFYPLPDKTIELQVYLSAVACQQSSILTKPNPGANVSLLLDTLYLCFAVADISADDINIDISSYSVRL